MYYFVLLLSLLLVGCSPTNTPKQLQPKVQKSLKTPIEDGFYNNYTALHLAARLHREDIILWLLDNGENVNVVDDYQSTPLHQSAYYADVKTLNLLLLRGALLEAKTLNEETPLHLAVTAGSLANTNFLLTQGADIYAQDKQGENVLHKALLSPNNSLALIKLLLNNGAVIVTRTKEGKTPLDYATMYATEEIKSYLFQMYEALNLYLALLKGTDIYALQEFIKRYPKLIYTAQIQNHLDNLLINLEKEVQLLDKEGNIKTLQNYFAQYPFAKTYLRIPKNKLLFIGPTSLSIYDIKTKLAQNIEKKELLELIKQTKGVYKVFSLEERNILKQWGFSSELILILMQKKQEPLNPTP